MLAKAKTAKAAQGVKPKNKETLETFIIAKILASKGKKDSRKYLIEWKPSLIDRSQINDSTAPMTAQVVSTDGTSLSYEISSYSQDTTAGTGKSLVCWKPTWETEQWLKDVYKNNFDDAVNNFKIQVTDAKAVETRKDRKKTIGTPKSPLESTECGKSGIVDLKQKEPETDTDTETDVGTDVGTDIETDVEEEVKEAAAPKRLTTVPKTEDLWPQIKQLLDQYGGDMNVAVQKLLSESNELLTVIASIQQEKTKVDQELGVAKEQLKEIQTELKTKRAECSATTQDLQTKQSNLQNELANFKNAAAALQKDLMEQLAETKKDLDRVREQTKVENSDNAKLKKENENLQGTISAIKNTILQSTTALQNVQAQNEQLKTEQTKLQQQIAESQSKLKTTEDSLNQAKARVEDLQKDLSVLSQQQGSMSSEITEQLDQLNTRLKLEKLLYADLIHRLGAVNRDDPDSLQNIAGFGMSLDPQKRGIALQKFYLSLLIERTVDKLKQDKVESKSAQTTIETLLDTEQKQLESRAAAAQQIIGHKIAWQSLSDQQKAKIGGTEKTWNTLSPKEQNKAVGFDDHLWNLFVELNARISGELALLQENREGITGIILKQYQ
jgi:septal ring factor EnvC (AmiA/AmiB activator)